MADFAHGLPVVLVPEKIGITLMWAYMINNRCKWRVGFAFMIWAFAERMRFQKASPSDAPTVAIAALICGSTSLVLLLSTECFMFRAESKAG
jgi:hypothetical protein